MSAHIRFYYGSMSSSKTLRLLSTAYDFEEKGIQIMVLKPARDTRDGDGVIRSRAGLQRPCVMVDEDINVYDAIKTYANVLRAQLQELKWILVDEAQFLTIEQVDQLTDVVDYLNINVICYGLRTDFQGKLFPASQRLFELADDIEEVKSTCGCCGERKTSINARVDKDGNLINEGEQIMVGGNESYQPMCRKCWKEKLKTANAKDDK